MFLVLLVILNKFKARLTSIPENGCGISFSRIMLFRFFNWDYIISDHWENSFIRIYGICYFAHRFPGRCVSASPCIYIHAIIVISANYFKSYIFGILGRNEEDFPYYVFLCCHCFAGLLIQIKSFMILSLWSSLLILVIIDIIAAFSATPNTTTLRVFYFNSMFCYFFYTRKNTFGYGSDNYFCCVISSFWNLKNFVSYLSFV